MITNKQLVSYCEKALGHEYWYGCFGNKATESLLAQKKKQYPKYYNRANYTKGWTCNGERVFDCVNLIKAAVWSNGNFNVDPVYNSSQDYSANTMLAACKIKGKINTLPEVPGVLVFKTGHVGVYIGGGYVIHAGGHNKGVVKEKLMTAANWTDWGYCPLINYETTTTTQVKSQTNELKDTVSNAVSAAVQSVYTHKVTEAVNVRSNHSTVSLRAKYVKFPEYIKKQMKLQTDYIPAGVKIICFDTCNGWYKIDDKTNLWIAGNYTSKL